MSLSNPASDVPPFMAVLQMVIGKWISAAISTLARLGIADHVAAGPKTAAELAATTGSNEHALYRLMRATASLGVLTELEDGRFAQTPLSAALKTDARPGIRNLAMLFGDEWHTRSWLELPWCIETGRPAPYRVYGKSAWEMFQERPDQALNFNNAMTDMSQNDGPAVAFEYDFSGFSHIVDVAGGLGTLLVYILEATPNLRGTLFEIPSVVEEARTSPILAPVLDRCAFESGSFFESVPMGADAYILKHIIHDWDDQNSTRILSNIRKAIAPSGKLLVVENVVEPRNQPGLAKFMDLEMLVAPGGLERTEEQWRKLFEASGFRLERMIPIMSGQKILQGAPV